MDENTTQENGLLENCAELATWHQLEADPAQKERIAAELAECVKRAAKEEAEKKEQETKAKDEAKAAKAAEHAAWEKEMLERVEQLNQAAPDLKMERTIEIPQHIRDNPIFQQVLDEQRAMQANRITTEAYAISYQGLANVARFEVAELREKQHEREQQHEARQDPATPGIEKDDFDPYEKAAAELDAKTMKEGQEIEGEVVDIAKVDGQNYYVLEQDGERLAIPAGNKPEHDQGDEITASRTKEGFETAEAYGYGR